MPLLFLERFPWPSLRTYTALSALALLGAGLSAYRALSQAPGGEAGTESDEPQRCSGPRALDVAYYLLSDSLCVWVSPGRRRGLRARGLRGWLASGSASAGTSPRPGGGGRVRGVSRYCCLKTARGIKKGLGWVSSARPGPPPQPFPFLPARGGGAAFSREPREFSPRLVLLSLSGPRSSWLGGLGEAVGSVCRAPRRLLGLSFSKHCLTCTSRNLSKGLSGIRAQALPAFINFLKK